MKAKKKSAKPAAKPVSKTVKPAAKSKAPSGLKLAASKLKTALLGKKKPAAKPVAKPAPKPAPKKALIAKAAPKVAAKPPQKPTLKTPVKPLILKNKPKTSAVPMDMPKGLPSEAQIRRMSDKDYMNDVQLAFFRHKLMVMRKEVVDREVEVKERLHEREVFADPADRATAEEEHWLDLRLRERESLLLRKVDEALRRIEGNEFGYCEKTGDPIGIPRLLARPTATVCVDVKGQDERVEAQFRDR